MGKKKHPELYVYMDEPTGGGTPVGITTHSMMKTMRRCPKQFEYKYIERLKPRTLSKPLTKGTWMHSLLEWKYKGLDWQDKHAELTKEFNNLFDEEKDDLGPLPEECERLMRAYLWHYKFDVWKVHEVEVILETEFPDGSLYRGRIDLLIENEFGLWIVDHKNMKTIPDINFRILDAQSALYIWAAARMGIPVQGFIWNFLRTKPPSIPKAVYNNTRISDAAIDTDYLTYGTALKQHQKDGVKISQKNLDKLAYLKSHRYQWGSPQTSPFFQRHVLEKSDGMIKRIAQEGYHTSHRMNTYPWARSDMVERVPDRSCSFSCSYTDLCTLELFGGNTTNLRKQRYKVGDPNDYYKDDKVERGDGI